MTSSAQVKGLLGEVDQILDRRYTEQKKSSENLLAQVRRILEQQREISELTGETFNVFSILGMEKKENQTHSAFIGELLNPDGSHLQGNAFLKLFLKVVEFEKVRQKELNVESAYVVLEKHIGQVRNGTKTGGRIDIYIADETENSISIENKIRAVDQYAQVERYYMHNEERNTVYYLTLNGDDPSPESKGDLEAEEHYFNISYRKHIIEWLELCLKESANQPILRETIKQYIVLIKRLTHTMNDKYEKELFDLLLQNSNEANYVVENFSKAKQNFCEELCETIVQKLKHTQNDKYTFEKGKIDKRTFVQIKLKEHEQKLSCFAVGPFHDIDERLFFGIYNVDGENIYEPILEKHKKDEDDWIGEPEWPKYYYLLFDGKKSSIIKMLPELHTEKEKKREFIEHIVSEVQKYISPKQHS